jgi:predicted DNA-binding transcriptional regulator AlpA
MAYIRSKGAATDELTRRGLHPRMLRLALAAAYVGLSQTAFKKAVAAGRYPKAVLDGRCKRWDIRALDAAIDRHSGIASSSPRDESPEAITRAFHEYHTRVRDC